MKSMARTGPSLFVIPTGFEPVAESNARPSRSMWPPSRNRLFIWFTKSVFVAAFVWKP